MTVPRYLRTSLQSGPIELIPVSMDDSSREILWFQHRNSPPDVSSQVLRYHTMVFDTSLQSGPIEILPVLPDDSRPLPRKEERPRNRAGTTSAPRLLVSAIA